MGNKPGVIAYLGDVKFAVGDFAGVVLGKTVQPSYMYNKYVYKFTITYKGNFG